MLAGGIILTIFGVFPGSSIWMLPSGITFLVLFAIILCRMGILRSKRLPVAQPRPLLVRTENGELIPVPV